MIGYTLKRQANGRWLLRFRPDGRAGKQVSRRFDLKREGERYMALVIERKKAGQPWNVEETVAVETRRLSDFVELWFDVHGHTLKQGEKRKGKMLHVAKLWGDPLITDFDAAFFMEGRRQRLAAGTSLTTTNNDLENFKGMFNELMRSGDWVGGNPLALVKRVRVDESEMSWLDRDQIVELLAELKKSKNPDVYHIAKLCLATGARWGEAEKMTAARLRGGVAHFVRTKTGKARMVPISAALVAEITDGRPKGAARLFGSSMKAFRGAISRVSFTLPKGQMTHVLRHTFASHFVQNGGDLLTLQRILGHATLTMTMRYAHLAPNHLQAAISLNPLVVCGISSRDAVVKSFEELSCVSNV